MHFLHAISKPHTGKERGKLRSNLVGAAEGDGDSCTKAGLCLEFGTGTEKNIAKAVSYFKKGYEAGSIEGRTKYGSSHFYGWTIPPNTARGFKLWNEASELGDVGADPQLAQCYEYGIAVPRRSTVTAFRLMESAYKKRAIWAGRKLARY